jgi:hypothetical protein
VKSGATFTLLLLVACALAAQVPKKHAAFVVMAKPPTLPAIAHDVLSGEGWALGTYKLRGQAVIFDTWKPSRRRLTMLDAGTPVTMLSGLCEVSKADLVTVPRRFQIYN